MVPRIALGSQRARPCIESFGVSGAWASSRARTMATRGPVSTTARSLTSKAFHLVRVGGEVRRGLGSSTLEAAVEASLTQDIKSRHLALIRPAPWPRRGLPALVDLMIDKGRCLAPYPGRRHPSSIPSHSESTIPARALAPSDGLALAHAGLAIIADAQKPTASCPPIQHCAFCSKRRTSQGMVFAFMDPLSVTSYEGLSDGAEPRFHPD
jgi:hypothetical protein